MCSGERDYELIVLRLLKVVDIGIYAISCYWKKNSNLSRISHRFRDIVTKIQKSPFYARQSRLTCWLVVESSAVARK